MKKTERILWGLVLIALGVVLVLNLFHITDIDLFFDGWWTLLIIVPCAVGLFTQREKTGNIIGILVGGILLLCCRDILSFSLLWKLLVPAVILIIGLQLLLTGLFGRKAAKTVKRLRLEGKQVKSGVAVFSGYDASYDGEVFEGAELTAVFGGIECDLRNAIIEKDCPLQASAIFGGIDVFVPAGINVKVSTTGIFGGCSNKTAVYPGAPTLYISGACIFGGIEIQQPTPEA